MIHFSEMEGAFGISSHNVWRPGSYDSKRAANYAFRFSDEELQRLQDQKNKTSRTITFEDLQQLAKELREEK